MSNKEDKWMKDFLFETLEYERREVSFISSLSVDVGHTTLFA